MATTLNSITANPLLGLIIPKEPSTPENNTLNTDDTEPYSINIGCSATPYPGGLDLIYYLQEEKVRKKINSLIVAFSENPENDLYLTKTSKTAALGFFTSLPFGMPTPKIKAEEDGMLVVVWDTFENPIMVMIDGWHIHFIENAGKPNAKYYKNLAFNGEVIPDPLLISLLKGNISG